LVSSDAVARRQEVPASRYAGGTAALRRRAVMALSSWASRQRRPASQHGQASNESG